MQKLFNSDVKKYFLIIPFSYAFVSRYHWPRDFLINAATAWAPGVILVTWQSGLSPLLSVPLYILGYLCFICLYEIGYIFNDSFGLRHDPTPRPRVAITFDKLFVFTFILARGLVFSFISVATGLALDLAFWTASAALMLTLILHNIIKRVELRIITFLQLSLMRFGLPILFSLLAVDELEMVSSIFMIGLLLFTYPRILTYLEAKGRLALPERRTTSFLLFSHCAALPLILVIGFLDRSAAPAVLWAWFTVIQLTYFWIDKALFLGKLKRWLGLERSQGRG